MQSIAIAISNAFNLFVINENIDKLEMSQPEDISEICSTLLKLPKQSVPFEIKINCNLEI